MMLLKDYNKLVRKLTNRHSGESRNPVATDLHRFSGFRRLRRRNNPVNYCGTDSQGDNNNDNNTSHGIFLKKVSQTQHTLYHVFLAYVIGSVNGDNFFDDLLTAINAYCTM